MGTPVFATAILTALLESDVDVVAIVCQPDKKVGRKQILTAPPIKKLALEHGLMVHQPQHIKDLLDTLKQMDLDAIITCAYGMFLPQSILDIPKIDCINVHASLLPKYRGGAPIHRAVMAGETQTGISLMRMIKKMDAGDVYVQRSIPIHKDDTTSMVHDNLMVLGHQMIKEHLAEILAGRLIATPQNDDKATFAPIITSEDERVDMSMEGKAIYDHIRGLIDHPYAYVLIDDHKVKIIEASFVSKEHYHPINRIIGFDQSGMQIALRNGILNVVKLQIEGKKVMEASQVRHGSGRYWIDKEVY